MRVFDAMRMIVSMLAFCAWSLAQESTAKEAALGAQMSREIRAGSTLVRDAAVRGYVSDLATKLMGPKLLLTLEVIDDDNGLTHEPIWLPGGYMFVSAALIRTARDEAEFAGMLAHALAHEMIWDVARTSTVPQGSIPLIWVGGEPLWAVRQFRPFELEADGMAVKMIAEAGYDAGALDRYLTRVNPSDRERIDAIRKASDALPPQLSPVVDSSRFQNVRERLDRGYGKRGYRFSPTLR